MVIAHLFEYNQGTPTGRLAPAQRLLTEALDTLDHAAGPAAGDTEMLSVLTVCEGAARRLDLIAVHTVAALQRRGVFADRGYKNPIGAVADLLGCEWADARRRVLGAQQVCQRVGLDGTVLPPRLPATAAAFEDGRIGQALADLCAQVLTYGEIPDRGGHRPHLNVIIRLEDLQQRARAAMLDFGGTLTPESLRMLACDAGVVPVVMNGPGQPLDVGRLTRVIPDGIRRAVAARDGGCARCGRPPSWCEIHHVLEWENNGPTRIDNCVMLCRPCHRLIHHSDWQVRMDGGRPEFIPPGWIDIDRKPRQRPMVHLLDIA